MRPASIGGLFIFENISLVVFGGRKAPATIQVPGSVYRWDADYLFERRQVAGAVPNAFLKAREKAASEL